MEEKDLEKLTATKLREIAKQYEGIRESVLISGGYFPLLQILDRLKRSLNSIKRFAT